MASSRLSTQASQDLKVRLDRKARQAIPVARLVLKGRKAMMDHPARRVCKALQATMAHRERKVRPDPLEQMAKSDLKDRKVRRVILVARWARKARRARMEMMVRKALRVK